MDKKTQGWVEHVLFLILLFLALIFLPGCEPRVEEITVADRWWTWWVKYTYETEEWTYHYDLMEDEWVWGWDDVTHTRCEETTAARTVPAVEPYCYHEFGDTRHAMLDYYIKGLRLTDESEVKLTIRESDWNSFPIGSERQVQVGIFGMVLSWTDDF